MMDVILRNLMRLTGNTEQEEPERIEPMSEWKWRKLYSLTVEYGIGPWVAEGMLNYADDFFLQPSPALRQQLLDLQGEKNEKCMERFLLSVDRSISPLHHFTRKSLRAYMADFIHTLKNIEE